MKTIYAPKPNTPAVPQHRSFRRFINQIIASILKHQDPNHPHDIVERLQNLEHQVEMMARAMARQARRGK
jgi:hypothetical protein